MSTPVASDSEYFDDIHHRGYGSGFNSKFPVHDACEFHDLEFLRSLIFVRQNDTSSQDSSDSSSNSDDDETSSSSDDESSGTDGEHDNAAAAAAVMGHAIPPSSTPANTIETQQHDASIPPPSEAAKENNGSNGDAEGKEATDTVEKMDVAPEYKEVSNDIAMGTPTPVKDNTNPSTDVEAISPEKLDSRITDEATPNVEMLASKLGVNIKGGNGAIEITATESEATRKEKKKNKKEKKKSIQDKQTVFYCPHNLDLRDLDENTPLHVAIHARKIEHVRLLLQAGASCDRKCDGSAPIHTTISIGAITAHKGFAYEAAVLLKEHNADLTVKDEACHTPLYLTAVCNIPSITGLILSVSEGLETLNTKSDRSGGRPLHAAAKFDFSKPKTSVKNVNGNGVGAESIAAVTQILLSTAGIEVDARNNFGRTPLHVAASFGNWQVVRLLLKAGSNPSLTDQRGLTPGGLAYKRGIPIPSDLSTVLGSIQTGIPSSMDSSHPPQKRDLIIDPDQRTFLICHELCSSHLTCPPIERDPDADVPPENIRRLSVLLNKDTGILRGAEFDGCKWEGECRRASIADVLKVHEYSYVENINRLCNMIQDHPKGIAHLDGDTAISRWSFEAALRAAGSVCDAVDRIMAGDFRNSFCAVRPPGHHAGPRGIVRCENDAEGSHGFCLLNNVAIGAAYARSMYRNDGIKKIAIIDFDVHHGNGTQEVIRQLSPNVEKANVRMSFASGTFETPRYKPWLDETDVDNIFFASAHGYGPRCRPEADFEGLEPHMIGWFYPASGQSYVSESLRSPVETPDHNEFLLSQTWTRMGEENRMNCCKVINVGLSLPKAGDVPGMQRVEVRDAYRKRILPHLLEFNPDIIFISAGFDGHKRDTMNYGYVGMVEEDYEWVTDQLVKVANTCCNGRIVSVLEGGYKIHGGIVSPFARSVASHVRALVEGGSSREQYDKFEAEWESQFEKSIVEDRERKRQLRMERLSRAYNESIQRRRQHFLSGQLASPEASATANDASYDVDAMMKEPLTQNQDASLEPTADDEQPRKRRRNQVDYKELYEQLRKEGVA